MSANLNAESRRIAEDCAQRSHAGLIDFGSVVRALGETGIESYFTDYRRGEHTYYASGGETYSISLPIAEAVIADAFDADAVNQAVRGAQSGAVKYPEFVRRTMAAGCVGYFVWIAGRQVQYFGRRGEIHVERFPQ
ncbi:DUF1398 family protein [Paraburkholderia sp. RP-4-7]|uniref:DUF1398 family protein n=1 Tax=Paraburkholderia polaris TaxID=2728848 RepID=A0A848IFQ8_9BURK|nr:DUF1398 family protein [Paraburkholderia polaris]NMM01228.1 DUF1398 family protein [Paraburkholderia polaris]